MKSKRQTLYKSSFQTSIDEIVSYIEEQSPYNAIVFLEDLKKSVEWIIKYPEATSIEKHLPTKKNWYRFKMFKKRYKILFKLLNDKLVFLTLFHTAQHPDELLKFRTSDYT